MTIRHPFNHAWHFLFAIMASSASLAAQPLGCLIEPNQVVELGSPVIGVLEKVFVDRGAAVRKGQVLATLKSDVERAAADVAKSRVQAEADVQAAIANRDYNRQRLTRAEELVKKNFIATQALDQAKTESDVAEQHLAQTREQKRIWDHEYAMARAQLALRSLISPFTGVVVDRYLSPGERVEQQAVLKIAALNPLRVEVFMPAASYREVKPGMSAKVLPELPDAGEHTAKVILVDRVIDPASNTFRVRLELPNPGNALPAGLRCKVVIGDQVINAGNDPLAFPAVSAPPPPAAFSKPHSKVAPSAPKTTAMPASEETILAALERWKQAWESKNLSAYLAAYVEDFRGNSANRQAWLKLREARILKPGPLSIQVSEVKVRPVSENKAQVHFRQKYQSTGYRADTLKSLMMVLDKGKWLIQEEHVQPK